MVFPDLETLDRRRLAGLRVDVDDGPVQADIVLGDIEQRWSKGNGRFENAIDTSSDDALVWPGHADVAHERGASGKDLFVRGRYVRMGTKAVTDSPVEMPSHQLLVAGCFGVEINATDFDVGWNLRKNAIDRRPRAIDGTHEDSSHHADDRDAQAFFRLDDGKVFAGCGSWIVGRFDNVGLRLKGLVQFLTPIDVISHGDAIDPGIDQLAMGGRGESRATACVFCIGYHQGKVVLLTEARDDVASDVTTYLPDDVSDVQNPQGSQPFRDE